MKFNFRNALIGGLTATTFILFCMSLVCFIDRHFFISIIIAVMMVMSIFALFGIVN